MHHALSQWFVLHDPSKGGSLRPKKLCEDLLTEAGKGNAVRYLKWVAEGAQGYVPARPGRKKETEGLVSVCTASR